MKRIILINFKTYKEASGRKALKLAKICEKVSKITKKEILIAVQTIDIKEIVKSVKIKVLAQHLDYLVQGPFTGSINSTALKEAGIFGTLLNHSEKRLKPLDLEKSIKIAKLNKLKTFVCAASLKEIRFISKYNPDYIAIEPPELIGGNRSVSKVKPNVIIDSIKATNIPILCGAGIKTKEDIQIAYKLGAKGILISSGIVKAKSPFKELLKLSSV